MTLVLRLLASIMLLAASPTDVREAPPTRAFFEALRAADLRLATIAYRLTTGNVALCEVRQPQLGMPVHGLGQYGAGSRPTAKSVFGFETAVGVEAVVPGGPAARAGLRAGDSLVAINGAPLPTRTTDGPTDRDEAEAMIAAAPPGMPVRLDVLRDGRRTTIAVPSVQGCASRFEILLGSKLGASADGSIVQLGEQFFEGYSDAEIAVVVAHELAHNILRHRSRLDDAKISRGMLAELGRNGRLIRRTEGEADLLGVYLLANAGYDARSAAAFWRRKGGDVDGGLFRSRTHASSKARATTLEAAAREIAATPQRPIIPTVIATRDEPLR